MIAEEVKRYKFSIFNRPRLKDFYYSFVKDKFEDIIINIYAYDLGKYKVCQIDTCQLNSFSLENFIYSNSRLKVFEVKYGDNDIEIECF